MSQVVVLMTPVTQLGTGATVLYTQGANSIGQVLRATLYNTEASTTRLVTLYRVASGGSPTAANTILGGQSGRILAGQAMVVNVLAGMALQPGDTIQGLADAATAVNFTMSGYNNT